MELLQLKYFCDAAKSENFSHTAQKFGIPSSGVSQSIRRLERELGVELFTRHSNKLYLNDKGKLFYEQVTKSLKILSDAVSEVSNSGGGERINMCVNTNRRIVMNAVEKFRNSFPGVTVTTKHFCDPLSDDFDMIVSNEAHELTDFASKKLLSERIGVAFSQNYNIEASNGFSSFRDIPFVTMSDGSSLYKITKSVCNDYGFEPKIVVQSDDPFYVRRCVELGLGVAIVPMVTWKGQFAENVLLKTIDNYTRVTYVYTDPHKYLSAEAKRFIELLVEEFRIESEEAK